MKSGIYTMSAKEYHSDILCPQPSLSSSIAHILCTQSPAHAKAAHPRLTLQPVTEEAEHLDIGTIAHALMLEGEHIAEVIDADNWRTKDARQARDMARAQGKVPILRKHWDDVASMIVAAKVQLGHKYFTFGKPEVSIAWQEPNGVYCRGRLDFLLDNLGQIQDYKTGSGSMSPDILSRTMVTNGWDIQAAFYIRGVKMIYPEANPSFVFVCQETYPPYAVSLMAPGPDVLFLAEKKVQYAIDKFGECLTSGVWPAYPDKVCFAELPAWHEAQWLEKELREV